MYTRFSTRTEVHEGMITIALVRNCLCISSGDRGWTNMGGNKLDCHIVTWQYGDVPIELEAGLRALASDRRLQILEWLRDPTAHFRPQVDGDLVKDGVCGLLITEKLGVSQPTASEHLRVLADAGFLCGKRIKQWIFYRRDEKEIVAFKALLKQRI
jgi:DNA-binding transcriptional ArsR family regulator